MAVTIRDIRVIATAPEGINLLVVKVETSEPGLYGLGCATFAYRHLTVQHLVETYLRPLLIGRDVRNITELWQLMHQNAYWRCGPVVNNAISGVDMALWDIKGKMANMPVYDLFGGKMRAGVPVYRHVDGADVDDFGFIQQNNSTSDNGHWILITGAALMLLSLAGFVYLIVAGAKNRARRNAIRAGGAQPTGHYSKPGTDYDDGYKASAPKHSKGGKRYK